MKLLLFLINLTFAASFKSKLYNNTAIITIATGGYNANSLVSSLRNKGKWNKNIYIFSDPCTPKINNTVEIRLPKITKTPLESKILKMEILNYTSEDFVLFLDSDIVLNKPITYFFNKINIFDNNCDAYMPHDMWYSKKFKINGGIIFVKRNKSNYFLQIWKDTILNRNYKGNKDQPALKKLIEDKLINICIIHDSLIFYAPDTTNKYREISTAVFTHYLKFKNNYNKC